MCAFSNLRVLHNNKTPKWQSIKLMINRSKQSNPHTNAVSMKSYNSADTHARKTTTSWLFHPHSLFAVKSSRCLPRLFVCQHKSSFKVFFILFIPLLPMREFDFLFSFFIHYLSVISSFFFYIIRGKVHSLTTCFVFFFWGRKSLLKQKENGRLRCHPFERMERRPTERLISCALIGLSSITRQTRNILVYASWMA